ncbi:hypothetical protein HPB48_026940 [Haemaphysalis longicornis]|uniref:RNase H type-1 domain-containing protein n=1 Tax=Haemaphysalis longicornis TaxID=44386 RepID=A0A9J6HAR5_HAELO|nr:hypothetical protein HPB48_026940 [Haemaphysalis longicornis]
MQHTARYLGITLDRRLTWLPLVQRLRAHLVVYSGPSGRWSPEAGAARRSGPSAFTDAAGVSHLLYALPFVALNRTNWKKIETDHTAAIRLCLGLPRISRVAATLTEGNAWPAQLRVQQTGLNYIDRLSFAPDGAALLRRLQSRPLAVAGKLAAAHRDLTGQAQPLPATDPLPPHPLRFSALEVIDSGGAERLELYTDGSVLPGPPASAAAACPHKHAPTVTALHAKLTHLASGGCEVCVQWLPLQVGIAGNEAADRLAKAAHTEDTPTTTAVSRIDEARFLITEEMLRKHPHERVPAPNAPARIPRKFGRQEAALLSMLRTGCALYESTAHCLTRRGRLQQAYARLGVACSTKEDMLFPLCHRILLADAFQHLLTYLDETGLAARL